MLFATSLTEARDMLADLMKEAGKVGLEVHLGKTSFLPNGIDVNKEVEASRFVEIASKYSKQERRRCT